MNRVAGLLVAVGLLGGCVLRADDDSEVPAPDPVFSQHQPVPAESPHLSVGEDCSRTGASGCMSGLCLHTSPEKDEGYLCSTACTSSADCPQGWMCTETYPGPNSQFCVPTTPSRP